MLISAPLSAAASLKQILLRQVHPIAVDFRAFIGRGLIEARTKPRAIRLRRDANFRAFIGRGLIEAPDSAG